MLTKKEKEREEIILKTRKLCLELDELHKKLDEKVLSLRGSLYNLEKAFNKDFGRGKNDKK